MEQEEIVKKLDALEKAIEENTRITRQLRLYFILMVVISAAVVILPLIGLLFVLPGFLSSYGNLGI
ncbi:MAG: hypothetical protein PHC85_01970 [Candidatus Pacebacteria bacterium]|nr:hypothetical protein [Candidatus Paceibacterota bacterium]